MKSFLLLLIISPVALLAQNSNDFISVKAGISSTNILIREAIVPTADIFGSKFDPGKTFAGRGPELGISKELNNRMYIELSYSGFSGEDYKIKTGIVDASYENYYTLRGFQIPVTVNYLIRRPGRKLRMVLGAGVQYINIRLKQYETFETIGGYSKRQYNFNISEFQMALQAGIQYRIIPNLNIAFNVRAAFMLNGRYSDSPSLTLKYSFRKKNKK